MARLACSGPVRGAFRILTSGHYVFGRIFLRNNFLVKLFTANTNKWSAMLNRGEPTLKSQVTNNNQERTVPIRQRQRRLCEQVIGDDLYLDVLNSF